MYRIEYSPSAIEHLRILARDRVRVILDSVDDQLQHQPAVETRNRKPMRPNPVAPWELRISDFRVYYEVDEPFATARVLAVGVKERNTVRIGREVFEQ